MKNIYFFYYVNHTMFYEISFFLISSTDIHIKNNKKTKNKLRVTKQKLQIS